MAGDGDDAEAGTDAGGGENGDPPERTEHLRDVFESVTGTDTATETQRGDRGSLLDQGGADGRLSGVVAEMRETLGFETALDDDALARVVRRFYEGADDAAIAADLGVGEATVRRARADLHLLRKGDADPGLVAALHAGDDPDADPTAVERAERVVRVHRRSRRVSERFRTAFEELLTDADIQGSLAADARADGLREAAADIEPDPDLDF